MIDNLQFYSVTALIGFFVSLAFRKEEEIARWRVYFIVFTPIVWALTSIAFIMIIGNGELNSVSDILKYFDARNFYPIERPRQNIRVLGVIALLTTFYFFVIFDLVWRIKNKLATDNSCETEGDERHQI